MKAKYILILLLLFPLFIYTQPASIKYELVTKQPELYSRTEFILNLQKIFDNPYFSSEVTLDLVVETPSGKLISLPCFFDSAKNNVSTFKARFTPREIGLYNYKFQLAVAGTDAVYSEPSEFSVLDSGKDGFLHTNDFWTLKFDSGKLFRGIGENVGWEARAYEDPKWTYDYLLPTLSNNGANFFRTWMCVWNLPLDWQKVHSTNRYESTDEYYNYSGIKRLDELVELADSLGLYMMLTFETAGSLTSTRYVGESGDRNDAATKLKFFNDSEARRKYKDKLRYIVARWGYSTSIAAWEFFNEIDNGVFTGDDSLLVPFADVTGWHSEMSRYLTDIDPYDHIITTSISHRDILGMNSLPFIDLNQKHIYKRTDKMRQEIFQYIQTYNKPYTIGEFGFEWDWNIDFSTIAEGLDYDYKRGLWYGLFSPTPILPMTWWWEFFDERNMTPYFNAVRQVSDKMLEAGQGSFEIMEVSSGKIESYSVKCGDKIFVYLLNNSRDDVSSIVEIKYARNSKFSVVSFDPNKLSYNGIGNCINTQGYLQTPVIKLELKKELILILNKEGEL